MSNVIKFPSRGDTVTTRPAEDTIAAKVHQLQTPAMFATLTERVHTLLENTREGAHFNFSNESASDTIEEIVRCLEVIHAYPSEYSSPIYPELTRLAFKAIRAQQTKLVQKIAIIKELKRTEEESTHPALRKQRLAATAVLKHLEMTNPDLPPAS